MTKKLSLNIGLLCIISLLQIYGLSRLSLFHVSPDALSIFLAFLAVTVGQRTGMTFGFAAGTITGLLSGNLGLNMLSRTVEGFIAGYFNIPENSHATANQKSRRLYGAVAISSFAANAIFSIGYNPLGYSPFFRIAVLGLLETILTLGLAFLVNRLFLKKNLSD
ncbi:MAG: rod shape-determining protein MreD [Chlorobiaceae bacterium]